MRIRIVHVRTLFHFEVEGKEYRVICPSKKHGEHEFYVYYGQKYLGLYDPRGNHVNKTSAEKAIRHVLENKLSQ